MSIERARLLIRGANQTNNDSDRKALLVWAEEILENGGNKSIIDNPEQIKFPIRIFRRYKGELHEGRLLKGWEVEYKGKVFHRPSTAAGFISGHFENGWKVWKYINESNGTEQPIDRLR